MAWLLGLGGCDGGSSVPSGAPTSSSVHKGCVAAGDRLPLRADPAAEAGVLVGLHTGLRFETTDAGRCRNLTEAVHLGARGIREDLSWETVERRPGVFDWRATDARALALARRGLVWLPLLVDPPARVRESGRLPALFAAWTARVVERYGPGGTLWRAHPELRDRAPRWFELWNEPYIRNENVLSAPTYAALVRAAVTAGRAASPDARFLVAVDTEYRLEDGSVADWLAALFDADPRLLDVMDGAAVHPYGEGPPAGYDPDGGPGQVGRVAQIHDQLVRRGGADVPLWITELGWSTCTRRPGCTTEAAQARDLAATFAQLRGPWRPYVRAFFWFTAFEAGPRPADSREDHFGLEDAEGREKPVARVYRGGAESLGGR